MDFVFVALGAAFWLLIAGMVVGCDRLGGR
jgi:predicted benzoate:H+ symporter BenE